MGFLGGKPKVSVEEFCREFYDSQVFQAIVGGVDVVPMLWRSWKRQLQDADRSFAAIDSALFQEEMAALRLELFGLAWMHKFKHMKYCIPQSIFTRRYLEEKKRLNIWGIMGEYNKIISQSSTMNEKGEQISGRIGRGQSAFLNTMKMKIFEEYAKVSDLSAPSDTEKTMANCVARVANRIGAIDIRHHEGITARLLASRLAERLGCSPNMEDEAIVRMVASVLMLYDGAKESIKSVNLQL